MCRDGIRKAKEDLKLNLERKKRKKEERRRAFIGTWARKERLKKRYLSPHK